MFGFEKIIFEKLFRSPSWKIIWGNYFGSHLGKLFLKIILRIIFELFLNYFEKLFGKIIWGNYFGSHLGKLFGEIPVGGNLWLEAEKKEGHTGYIWGVCRRVASTSLFHLLQSFLSPKLNI